MPAALAMAGSSCIMDTTACAAGPGMYSSVSTEGLLRSWKALGRAGQQALRLGRLSQHACEEGGSACIARTHTWPFESPLAAPSCGTIHPSSAWRTFQSRTSSTTSHLPVLPVDSRHLDPALVSEVAAEAVGVAPLVDAAGRGLKHAKRGSQSLRVDGHQAARATITQPRTGLHNGGCV